MPPSFPRRCAVALTLALLGTTAARAQDTTRVRADTTKPRVDTVRIRDTVFIRDTAPVQVPATPPPPPPWHILFDLGWQDVGGNSALTVFNSAVLVEHRPKGDYLVSTKLEVRYGTASGLEAVNYQGIGLRADWHPHKRVSPFFGADATRDRTRLIGIREQIGVGLNLNTDTRDEWRTYFSLGMLYDHEEYLAGVTPGPSVNARRILPASTPRPIGASTHIDLTAKLHPSVSDFSNYLVHVTAGVRATITRHLGFTARYEYRRDSRPPPGLGVLPEDRSLTVALSFSF
jgi:hypothetical protein